MSGMHRDRIRTKKRKKGRLSPRRIIQLLSAALFNGYGIGFRNGKLFTGRSKSFCVPVLNCYSCPGALGACPIGALQTALGGNRHVPFYVLGLMTLFGVVLGRLVCGFLCPFGLVQDLLYKIPVPKVRVPGRIDRAGKTLKYAVLAVAVILLPAFAVTKTGRPLFLQVYLSCRNVRGRAFSYDGQPGAESVGGSLVLLEGVCTGCNYIRIHVHQPSLLPISLSAGGLLFFV